MQNYDRRLREEKRRSWKTIVVFDGIRHLGEPKPWSLLAIVSFSCLQCFPYFFLDFSSLFHPLGARPRQIMSDLGIRRLLSAAHLSCNTRPLFQKSHIFIINRIFGCSLFVPSSLGPFGVHFQTRTAEREHFMHF